MKINKFLINLIMFFFSCSYSYDSSDRTNPLDEQNPAYFQLKSEEKVNLCGLKCEQIEDKIVFDFNGGYCKEEIEKFLDIEQDKINYKITKIFPNQISFPVWSSAPLIVDENIKISLKEPSPPADKIQNRLKYKVPVNEQNLIFIKYKFELLIEIENSVEPVSVGLAECEWRKSVYPSIFIK